MDALMAVVSLLREHSCNDVNYLDTVKDLLTRKDMDRFYRMCMEDAHVDGDEYELFV